jgi:2-aminoethylphosphonate-pyruvate transaminase
MNPRQILLNPGPVTLSDRVRAAMVKPDLCHREKEFATLCLEILAMIGHVYAEAKDFQPVMLTGSGTSAVEAMLQSFASASKKTLVVANGVYGERMATMLTRQGKPFELIKGDWVRGIDLEAAESILKKDASSFSAIATVHHETTTGRLNDFRPLALLGEKHGIPLMVDAVSSFAAEDIDFHNLSAVAATGNKCLHSIPAISFVLAKKDILAAGKSEARSLYLDLFEYYKAQKNGFSPFTQSVQGVYALHEALREFQDLGGQKARLKTYLARRDAVLALLESIGVKTLIPREAFSSYLTSFLIPAGKDYDRLHDALKDAGYTIYAGQGNFSGQIFRIATMGDIRQNEMDDLLTLLKRHLT